MIFNDCRAHHNAPGRLAQLIIVSCLCVGMLSIIPTPFAVPGQQPGVLINLGHTLGWVSPGQPGWRRSRRGPVGSLIHQVAPGRGGGYYVAGETGLYRWTPEDGRWSQLTGGEVITVAEAESGLLIGTRNGVFYSPDQGHTWQATGEGLPENTLPLIIQSAPGDPRVIYLGTWQHGLFHSRDGGQHVEPINQGLPHAVGAAPVTPIRHLVVDPHDADTVYVSTEVNGIYKTDDGGQHWRPVTRGLPGIFPNRTYPPLLAILPTQTNTLYAVVGYPAHSHLIENKVYKTTDGGEHWFVLGSLPDNTLFRSLTIIPSQRLELIVGFEGGIIRVKDEGQREDSGPYRKPAPLRFRPSLQVDVGNIAVIEDDGTLNQNFDLQGRSIECVPTEEPGYTILNRPPSFEADLGSEVPLGDNDSVEVAIPFPFPFYGAEFNSVFVNSNGSVTFGRADSAPRPSRVAGFALFRLGAPKIAALWDDFDPTSQGSVRVKTAMDPERLVVTWENVRRPGSLLPDANTFQIVLLADGRIRVNYGQAITDTSGLVGLTPGNTPAAALVLNLSRDLPQTVDDRPVLEFFTGRGLDIQATAGKFYRAHEDLYDQLVVFGSGLFRTGLASPAAVLTFNAPVRNAVQGIGRPVAGFNGGPEAFGSAGRLQSFLNMNRLSLYPADPTQEITGTFTPLDLLGHETAHQWLAYLLFDTENGTPSFSLLTSNLIHWSFFMNSDASLMQGNRWRDNEDGTFTSVEATTRYSALDEYAMGLRPAEDIDPVFFIGRPEDPEGRTRDNLPEPGVTASGERIDVTIDQIISRNGPRQPGFGRAPTSLNQAYILVIPEGTSPLDSEVEKLDKLRRAFEPYFNRITGRRAVVDTRLTPGQPDLVVQAATVDPPLLTPGEAAAVSFTVRNQGTAAAGLVLNDIRFSARGGGDAGDLLLKQIATLSLAPGESSRLADIPVVIPPTTSPGTQFITLAIDAGDAASESDETNNQVVVPVTVMDSGLALTPVDESEPNDRPDEATLITPDTIITASLDPARDNDFYGFTAQTGQSVTIDINTRLFIPPSAANTLVALFDSQGRELAENDDFAGSPDSFLQFVIPRSGQYFVRVSNVPNAQGGPEFGYQAVVILRSPASVTESEPNDGLETANEIQPDVVVSGVLDPAGDEDVYVFSAGRGQILTVEVEAQSLIDPSAADTLLSVFDSDGNLIAENDDASGSTDSALRVRIPRAGRYFIRLRDVAGRGGPDFTYRATVRLAVVQQLKKPSDE